jgi:hypothetical protein
MKERYRERELSSNDYPCQYAEFLLNHVQTLFHTANSLLHLRKFWLAKESHGCGTRHGGCYQVVLTRRLGEKEKILPNNDKLESLERDTKSISIIQYQVCRRQESLYRPCSHSSKVLRFTTPIRTSM